LFVCLFNAGTQDTTFFPSRFELGTNEPNNQPTRQKKKKKMALPNRLFQIKHPDVHDPSSGSLALACLNTNRGRGVGAFDRPIWHYITQTGRRRGRRTTPCGPPRHNAFFSPHEPPFATAAPCAVRMAITPPPVCFFVLPGFPWDLTRIKPHVARSC